MNSNKFLLQFKTERGFSFFKFYHGDLKDDTGHNVIIASGKAILIEKHFENPQRNREGFPFKYLFEVVR